MTDKGPYVQFACFKNGKLTLFSAQTKDLDFITISHVWGAVQWLKIPGIDGDVLASTSKAKFIENELPGLVGETPFWMDTLTVNQRNQAEVIATVQAIPSIFRDATKTIAVREDDGLYDCCAKVVEGFTDWPDLRQKLFGHADDHWEDVYQESYLQRLWTLQECLLSHTIQFVVNYNGNKQVQVEYDDLCKLIDPGPVRTYTEREGEIDPYRGRTAMAQVLDSIYITALSFCSDGGDENMVNFIRAYIFKDTITRKKREPRSKDENIYTGMFRSMHLASNRSASKSRDYIFATMPQFPWYHYPPNAENMSFGAIFLDFYEQTCSAGHKFSGRITQSMINASNICDPKDAWTPSSSQPEPKCLGDFLKLLGQQHMGEIEITEFTLFDGRGPTQMKSDGYHITTFLNVKSLDNLDEDPALDLIEKSMRFSPRVWTECHLGGELSKFGCCPESDSVTEMLVARLTDPNAAGHHHEFDESYRASELARLGPMLEEERRRKEQDDWLHPQAMKILDNFWVAVDEMHYDVDIQGDWEEFKREMRGKWTRKLLRTLLLMAAMVSCQVPLSAITWAGDRFIPVAVQFSTMTVLGLLAKHACRAELPTGQSMLIAGRHPRGVSLGKDLVIGDPRTKLPVGLIPDFLHYQRTGGEFVDKISALYNGFLDSATPSGCDFRYFPLDKVEVDGLQVWRQIDNKNSSSKT